MSDEYLSDPAAERGVLAGVFQYGADAYLDVADIITPRTFTVDSNQHIWKCVEHVLAGSNDSAVDLPSILSAASALGLTEVFDKSEEKAHLRAVMNFPVRKDSVRRLAGKVRKLEVARLLGSQLDEAKSSLGGVTGDETLSEILSRVEGPVFDFTSLLAGQEGGPKLMGDGARDYLQYLMDNPRQMMGISTGYPRYDAMLGGGLRPNSLDIVAARAKAGKSFWTDNIALHVAGKLGIPVFNLDTEMSWEEHIHRVAANMAGVDIRDIETGKVGLKDLSRQQVLDAADRLASIPYTYESVIGKGFEDILASMRRWVTRTVGLDANGKAKPCVVIYDYLKMMSADFLSNDLKEYQALGFITTALKNFMGRFGVAGLAFAQLNREGINGEDENALSGSDRIVHYCTSLTYYKKKSEEELVEGATGPDGQVYTHKLIPVVSRHGEGLKPGDYVNILAEYRKGRIIEGPTRDELARGLSQGGVGVAGEAQGIVVDDAPQEALSF